MPELIVTGLAWFFAWLFAVAAMHKLRDNGYYRGLLASWFPGLPPGLPLAYLAACSELLVVIMLLLPATRSAGLLASAMLLLVYALAMGVQLAEGRRDLKCGCAGPASNATISPALLIRNVLCAALALLAVVSVQDAAVTAAGVVLSLALAAFLIAGYLTSEQLITNAQLMGGDA